MHLETLVRQLRADVEAARTQHRDAGPADLLAGPMEEHEEMAWMLRATLGE